MSDWRFLYNQDLCIGCNACQVACKDKNDLPVGIFFRRADTLERTIPEDSGIPEGAGKPETGGKIWFHWTDACHHCRTAPCVSACKTGAMHAEEDGTIQVDAGACSGCGACEKACPFGAVTRIPRPSGSLSSRPSGKGFPTGQTSSGSNALSSFIAAKCNACPDERAAGRKPACVTACLTRCLDFRDVEKEPLTAEEQKYLSRTEKMAALAAAEEGFRINTHPSSDGEAGFERGPADAAGQNLATNPEPTPCPPNTPVPHPATSPKLSVSAISLQEFADFFACKELALPIMEKHFSDWKDHTEKEWGRMYDDVLRGTNAWLEVPLWASTAFGEKILLNKTTLDVIRFCHRLGYEPAWIEGNPPDYIGTQLAFLQWLSEGEAIEREAAKVFAGQFTLPTARAMSLYLGDKSEVYSGMKRWMAALFGKIAEFCETASPASSPHSDSTQNQAGAPETASAQNPASAPETASTPETNPFFLDDLPADWAIPDAPARTINTAGINNCGGICIIRPTVQENCMLRIETDSDDTAPQLRACARGRGYRKTFLNPGRLRYPMKRVGKRGEGRFERITWEEAIDILAEQWVRIRDKYGPGSRYVLYGTGSQGVMKPANLLRRLLNLDGGYLGYFNSYSSACVNYMDLYLFGTPDSGHSAPDVLNTKLLILWGDNSAESIFGPDRNYYLAKLKSMGIKIICIDPRRSQTAIAYADEWIPIKPSTDAALADAMAYVIWSEGLQDQAFMDRYCLGFDEEHMPPGVPEGLSFRSYLFGGADGIPKTPEWAEPITGIPAAKIREIARLYAGTKPACIAAGLGAQRHRNGEQSAKGISMLCAMTGNIGIPGGSNGGNASNMREHMGISLFTDHTVNPFPGRIPTFLWTKAIERGTELTPKADRLKGTEKLDSGIKLLFSMASDLVNQHSDINDTARILGDETKCEFIVVSDIFMTPGARFADLLLPATSVFEGENIIAPWVGGSYILKNNPAIRPLFGCRFEWDWLKELADRLGLYGEFTEGKPELRTWLKENYDILRKKEPELPDYETFSAAGGWKYREPANRVAFADEIRDPEHHRFPTPSGKIEIFSKRLYDLGEPDVPPIPRYMPCEEGPDDPCREMFPLQLIGWHTRRRCHSVHDNNEWMDEVERPAVWVHPDDAADRGIGDGDTVEIFNRRGIIRMPAHVTDRIMKGVCGMPQGAWYTPDKKDGADIRGSINVLTGTKPSPLAKGNPQHTNLVEIRKI